MNEVNENIAQISIANQETSRDIAFVSRMSNDISINCVEVNTFAQEQVCISKDAQRILSKTHITEAKFDIAMIKAAHLNWRSKLEAVLLGKMHMEVQEVVNHHDCDFGKWYDNARKGVITSPELFEEIGAHHKNVHDVVKDIVILYNDGNTERAKSMYKDFENHRKELFRCLDEMYMS